MSNDQGEEAQLSFPLPPSIYYKQFTDENIKSNNVPQPPQPPKGEYSVFGIVNKIDDDIIQPLESQGIKRLYSKEKTFDHITEMKKLNHSILVNYLALLDIMIEAPESEERLKKIEEIKILFINLHHLINEFRPHQARETLRMMLHRQKLQRLETAERLKSHIEKTRHILKHCCDNIKGNTSELQSTESMDTSNASEKNNPDENKVDLANIEELTKLQHDLLSDIADSIS